MKRSLSYQRSLALSIVIVFCSFSVALGQLTGVKNIPGDYVSVTAAVNALNVSGVGAGGVTFNVAANYTETITSTISLTATGTAANPIVFQKDPSTTGANPLITAYTTGVGTPATAVQDGIWRLVGSDYVTINGIDVTDNPANTTVASTMEYGYALYKASTSNGCQFVTIENCVITLNNLNNALGTAPMVDGSTGIIAMNSLFGTATTPITPIAGGQNSNNKFYGNTIQNCNNGIAVIGYAAASPFTLADANNDIGGSSSATGNTIINFGGAAAAANAANGIRTLAQYGLNVSFNTINSNNGSGTNHPNILRGIFMNTATSANAAITNNTITVKGGGTTQALEGIENDAGSTAAGNTINISNNTITNCTYTTATTGGFYGIYNNNGTPATLTINNNTISNNSSAATTTGFFYGIQNSAVAPAVTINSNIISGNSTGALTTGLFAGVYNSASVPVININSNTLSGNATSALSGVYYAIYNKGTVTTTININSNNIGTSLSSAINFTAANSGAQILINNTKGGAAAALSISNNNFYNILYSTAGTGSPTYISNSAATLSQAINSNTFINQSVNTTGSITFISNSVIVPSSGTQNVNSNTISGTFVKSGVGGTVTLFTSAAASVSGSVINNNSNNFSNITVSGATAIAGWVNTDAGASNKTIQNNTFSNWVAGTGAVTAMNISLTGVNNSTTGNVINNITGAGTIVGITTGAGNDKIYSNTINTLASTGSVAVTGIVISGGTNQNIYANKIYDLQANNSVVGATVNGVMVSGTTIVNVNIYNNLIGDLRTPSSSATDPIRGIDLISTAVNSTINVYYNTIYINGTSTGANFGTTGIYHTTSVTATTSVLNLRNNIVNNVSVPNGTGLTVAYRRSSTTLTNYASTSNNNLFYAGPAGTNHLIFYDGTNSDQTLTSYKTRVSPADAQSVTEDLVTSSKFLSTTGSSASFLHLDPTKATLAESGAVNITNFTTDYDGDIRQGNTGYTGTGTAPDIGADEFNGTTPSALSGTYNVGTGQTYTSLTESGGLFAAINSLGLSGNMVVNITSDLTEDGTNALYQWAEQGLGNYTLTIQSNSSTLRTISGNALTGLIRLTGVKRVTIDGSNGTASNFLTFRNTNTAGSTGTAFTFINGASNNTIKYCNIEAYANATNGVILFSTSTVSGGNSNNAISNCSINATVSSNTGNICIYSAGTVGNENAANTISNNNIFNYRDRALDITLTGSKTWTINGNSFYNGSVTGAINYAAASTLHGIRILGGSGYTILNNYVGGSASLATGSAATYASTLGIISYQGILVTTSAAIPASNIKGNTVANISVSAVPTAANSTVFIGIESDGFGENVGGINTGDGNIIGSNTTNGSITVTTTTSTATFTSIIRGINCQSNGGLVTGNQAGSIDIKNIGTAPAPSTFIGIFINNASAPSQVNTNIIGSTGTGAASNSIRVLSTSTSTTTALTGIAIGPLVTSTIQLSGNTVQNISYQNSTGSGSVTGISNAAITTASVTITNNTITGNTTSAATGSIVGILSTSAPASVSISNNTISNNSSTSGTTGFLYGVQNSGAASSVSITGNTFSGNSTATLTTGLFLGFYNSSAAPVLNITGNTVSGNATTAASGVFYAIYNLGAVTTTININNNIIGTGSGTSSAITFNAVNTGAHIMINNTGGTAAAALSISNNNFQGVNYAVAGVTSTVTLISNTAATLSQAINGNTFTNLNINTAGSVTFIANTVIVSATGTQNVNNNSIVTAFTKKAGGTLTLFTSAASSVAGGVINNNNNNFSNITVTGATIIAGWVNTDAGAGTKSIQNNTFKSWSGGTSAVTVMAVNITPANNAVSGNIINNISGGGAVTGIAIGAGNSNIFSNTINTLSSTAVAAVTAISVTAGTAPNIYKNKIYDLSNSSATGSVNGMLISGGTTVTVYNNLIGDLRIPAANSATDLIRGINITSATVSSSINIYYNTIYINATSTGASFSTTGIYHTMSATATTAALTLRNNSITNTSTPKGTGNTVAFRRSGVVLSNYASASNNNLFYAGTPSATNLIYTDGAVPQQTMTTYMALVTPRDAQSVTQNLTTLFLSTVGSSSTFLHMDSAQPTLIESGAVNIAGITDDFDGQIRAGNTGYTGTSSSPDIGADEIFGVETIPPTITYTLLTNTTSTANRSLTGVTITDASGVNVAAGTKPRIYYKRSSDANAWLDNSPGTNGWKYTEATNSSSPFSFTIDYTLLHGGASVTAGVIQYFIVAQDVATTANIAINSGAFTVAPSSVSLTSAAFPITGVINSYNIPFSGTYNVGSAEIFTSLTKADGLFAAINAAGLAGNTTFNVTSDLTEDGTNALNLWTESGVGNYTLTIQPNAATLRTISGNVPSGLIALNGANRVTIDGSNGGSGIYLSFKNTNTAGTTGTAFTFINGASNNTIRYCDAEAYANASNGVILFSTSSVAGGNSNNLVDNCTINATVASNVGNVAVYSAGTVGNENSTNTISNTGINNYSNRGIDIASGSTGWNISGNDIYNGTATASINYPAATALNGIRVTGGSGYTILNNNIGGSGAGASGANAVYSSSLGSISYQGILLTTTSASPASNIKGNTIAAISLSTIPTAANSTVFSGIETGGAGINIGGTTTGDGNAIGSATANASIIVTTTTSSINNSSLINGINCASTGGIVTGNQVSGIDISNIGSAPAPSAFTGILINNASAPSQVNDNVVGTSGTGAISNSIRVLAASTSLTTSLNGIVAGTAVSSPVQMDGNSIQNISNLSTTSSGSFIGINNTATASSAVITITNDTVRFITAASNSNANSTIYTGISAASPSVISNNTIDKVLLAASGTAAQVRGIGVSGAFSYTISGNAISNLSTASTKSADIETGDPSGYNITGVLNSASVSGQVISGNTLSNFSETTTDAINTAITGIAVSTAAGSGNVYGNRMALFTNTATGISILPGISGIMAFNGSFNVYNNAIKFNNSPNTNVIKIYGINHATSNNWNYFYNTVRISGTGTGSARTAAFIRTVSGSLILRNNVLINTRTSAGANYAISNITAPASSNWPSTASNYNDLYNTNLTTTGEWGSGTSQTFGQFQTSSGGEANSVTSSVTFITSTFDLQPDSVTNCALSNAGTPVTTPIAITTDINNGSRNSTRPDLGAYEFNFISFVVVASNSSPVCLGGTVDLTVNPGNATNPVFSWRSPANAIISTSQNPTVSPIAGWYKVTVTDANGCFAVDSTLVALNTRPTARLAGATGICGGGSATLTLTVTGTGTISGTLNSGDVFSGTAPTITVAVTPATTTFYAISDMSDLNCSSIPSDVPDTVRVLVAQPGGWLGNSSSNWNDPTNWCGGVPIATTNVVIPNGVTTFPVINTGTNSINDISIENSTSLTVTGAVLKIAGAPANNGTFIVSNGTIEMNGTSAQTIPAAVFSGNAINNLTINNNAGVTLGGTLNLSGILLPANGAFNTGGFLTLISSATQTALIDGSGAGSVLGNVTMQRYLTAGYGYKYFSSPFQAATVSNFSGTVDLAASFPNFYTYIENQASSGFTAYTTATNTLNPLQGYAADFGSATAQKTVSITGVVNNGTISSTLFNHNQPYTQGFNLVGNPYPSPIDWNAASGWTKTNIDNAIYYFDSGTTSQYTGAYSTYINGVSSDGVANNIIASMQGFFVHVSNGTFPVTGTLTTTNSVRVNNLSPVFHKSFNSFLPPARILLRLSANFLDNPLSSDPLVVYTDGMATPAFDQGFDAIKLMNIDDQLPNLYSVSTDTKKLVINALSKLDTLTIIPIGLQTGRDGVVTFNLRDLEQWPYDLHPYLTDSKTGVSQDLLLNPDYDVSLKQGTYENRFSLRFKPMNDPVKPGNAVDIYNVSISDKAVLIHIKLIDNQRGDLIIFDVNGQIISRKAINGNGDYEMDGSMIPGVYLVSFITTKGLHTRKISLVNR